MGNAFSMPGKNSKYKLEGGKQADFLSGLWHGLLLPIFFIVSFFNDDVSIYETNNIGRLYNFGFLIGVWAFAGNTWHISIGTTIF